MFFSSCLSHYLALAVFLADCMIHPMLYTYKVDLSVRYFLNFFRGMCFDACTVLRH